MKKMMSTFLLCLLLACKSSFDNNFIKSEGWSYDGGYRITDFIDFRPERGYKIKGDTVFYDEKPRALIIRLDKKHHILEIKSLDGLKVGHYLGELGML